VSSSTGISLRRWVQLTVILLCAVLCVVSLSSVQTTNQLRDQAALVAHSYDVQLSLSRVESLVREYESRYRGYMLTGRQDFLGDVEGVDKSIREALQRIKSLTSDNPNQVQRMATISDLVEQKQAFGAEVLGLMYARKSAEARERATQGQGETIMRQLEGRIAEAVDEENRLLKAREEEVQAARSNLRSMLYGGMAAGVLLGLGLIHFLSRRLGPLVAGVRLAESIGSGDLTGQTLPVLANDEIGQLSVALNGMQGNLRRMAGDTRAAGADLAAAVQQISAAVQEQAASSQQQLAAVQETSTTMEEISRSAGQIAERSREVSAIADSSMRASTAGLQSVADTVRAANAIRDQADALSRTILSLSEKTQSVEDIVASVDDLADRSTLLALNAAIQAAAAGAEGRTFAIVAGEMKLLADQSKAAYVQVRSLLGELQRGIQQSVLYTEETVKRVEAGTSATQESERTLRRLVESVEESGRAFQQIGAATNQQQLAFDQVTQALLSIRQAAGQSEQGARQLREAATNLSRLGERLNDTVAMYRLG